MSEIVVVTVTAQEEPEKANGFLARQGQSAHEEGDRLRLALQRGLTDPRALSSVGRRPPQERLDASTSPAKTGRFTGKGLNASERAPHHSVFGERPVGRGDTTSPEGAVLGCLLPIGRRSEHSDGRHRRGVDSTTPGALLLQDPPRGAFDALHVFLVEHPDRDWRGRGPMSTGLDVVPEHVAVA